MESQEPSEPQSQDEDLVEEEAEAAAAEAGAIGGRVPDEDEDPAQRPLAEAGEGEAEGFEEAERDLIEHASHGDPAPDPSDDEQVSHERAHPEPEYGAADHEHSTERQDEDLTD
jgi:hypothetical protein